MFTSTTKPILIALICISCLFAGTPREYITTRTSNPPVIDGILDDDCWETVPFSGDFQMLQPYNDRPANINTRFAVLYDNDNLYIAVRAEDPEPDKILRQVNRRDNISSEFVAILIDSYHDRTTAYCFIVSAGGVQGDLFISKDGESNDISWDAVWEAKTSITEEGWFAELRIPFSQLRFIEAPEQIWGFNVMRNVYRNAEESFWDRVDQNESGLVHQSGKLRGLYDISPRKVLDIIPYTVGSITSYEAEQGNPYADGTDHKLNAGIDGKVGLSNNFTMDFTINPDFGQVEADPATVNLSAFETFFGERRPFFIEGNNITSFPLDVNGGQQQIFHSRRIGRSPHYRPCLAGDEYADMPSSTGILGAVKITGRTEKGLSIGFIDAVTKKETAMIFRDGREERETVEPLTNYSVAALRQELNESNTHIGAIATAVNRRLDEPHLEFLHKQAYSGGLDLRHYGRDRMWQIDTRAYGSYVSGSTEALRKTQESSSHYFQRPDAEWINYDTTRTHLTGSGGSVRLGKFSGVYQAALKVQWRSPGLELNDIGFMHNTDEIAQNIWLSYRRNSSFWIFNNFYASIFEHNEWNFGGMYQGSVLNLSLNSRLKNLHAFGAGYEIYTDYHSDTALRGGPRLTTPGSWASWLWYETSSGKDLRFEFLGVLNRSKYGIKGGHRLKMEASWKISANINVYADLSWDQSRGVFQYIDELRFENEPRYIMSGLYHDHASLELGLNINLSPSMSLEYRARPYFSSGRYTEFKRITDGTAAAYENRFAVLDERLELVDGIYYCDENNDGVVDYSFNDPDFVYNSFKSNLVFRWEYHPGSTLFLVWTRDNEASSGGNEIVLRDNIRSLNDEVPGDVFLVKISYRLGR